MQIKIDVSAAICKMTEIYTVYLEIFVRQNFRELPAELKFCVFIFANGDLTICISYINQSIIIKVHHAHRH